MFSIPTNFLHVQLFQITISNIVAASLIQKIMEIFYHCLAFYTIIQETQVKLQSDVLS